MPDLVPAVVLTVALLAYADALDDLGLIVLLPAAVLVVAGVTVAVESVWKLLGAGRRR